MHKKSIKLLSLLVALLVVLSTGCGRGEAEPAEDQTDSQVTEEKTTEDTVSEEAGYPKTMYVTAEDGLILRKEPGTDKEQIGYMNYGDEIKAEKVEKGWAYTTVDGQSGWCSTEYLTENKADIKEKKTVSGNDKNRIVEPSERTDNGYHGKVDSPEGVNMRYGPGEEYDVVTVIPDKAKVIEKGWTDDWVYIEYDGKDGWIKYEFFKKAA